MSAHIHPSILSADFVNFERDFATISTADSIHVDVMDGHFVPNLTFGLPMVRRMQEITTLPLDVHLMIDRADEQALPYADLGVDSVTFHAEASEDIINLARRIRAAGAKAGVAVKPGTPLEAVLGSLNEFDMVLVMTVEPGFGGQSLIESTLEKVAQAAKEIARINSAVRLQVDGGIDLTNIERAAAQGADTFVAGSAVFSAEDRGHRIQELKMLANRGLRQAE
jgi:ribulose-phosphate 3-epimerase